MKNSSLASVEALSSKPETLLTKPPELGVDEIAARFIPLL